MAANLVSVKAFGEFEFWFALIKVVTIVLMIIAGLGLILFGIGNGGNPIGISNYGHMVDLCQMDSLDFLCFIYCDWIIPRC